jgi:hypothetical protein
MSDPTPRAHLYKYADPLTGTPIWRSDNTLWNGQRPSGAIPLYDETALAEAVAREREACAAMIGAFTDRITAEDIAAAIRARGQD